MDENDPRVKRLREIEAKLEADRMMDPRGPAGAFDEPIPVKDPTSVLAESREPGWKQSTAEFVTKAGTTMAGAAKGARMAAPLAARVATRSPIAGAIVEAGGAALGAGAAGFGTEFGLKEAKRAMGLPGASDSVDESLSAGGEEFWNSAMGETWGRVLGGGQTALMPYRRAVSPESAGRMQELGNRIRGAYEKIGGTKLVEDTRSRWNPGRYLLPLEDELSDHAVVKRLEAAGLDPKKAREVALTRGLKPSELDTNVTSRFWKQVGATKLRPDESYERNTARLLQASAMNDFGTSFAKALPPEDLGGAINKAVWGRYDTLNGARKMAMQTLDDKLPEGTLIDMTPFKKSMGIFPEGRKGGVSFRPPSSGFATKHPAYDIAYNLPDRATFSDVETARTAIATMLRDQRTLKGPAEVAELEGLLKRLDDNTATSLPPGYKNDYRKFARADDARNKEMLDGAFVNGLLKEKPAMRAYADYIIKNTDVDSYKQLERVLMKQPGGARNIASLKSSIAERFMQDAAPNGIIDADRLLTGLGTQTEGYGKAFLDAVLGPQYSKNYIRYAKTMDEVNDAASRAGGALKTATTLVGLAAGVKGLFHGAPGMTGTVATAIATAVFAPAVIQKALTHPEASKLLLKTAENVASGRNPMITARLAGRVLEATGYAPEDFAASLAPEVPPLARVPQPSWRQPGMQGNWRAPVGPIRRDPANPIGQTPVPDPNQLGMTSEGTQ